MVGDQVLRLVDRATSSRTRESLPASAVSSCHRSGWAASRTKGGGATGPVMPTGRNLHQTDLMSTEEVFSSPGSDRCESGARCRMPPCLGPRDVVAVDAVLAVASVERSCASSPTSIPRRCDGPPAAPPPPGPPTGRPPDEGCLVCLGAGDVASRGPVPEEPDASQDREPVQALRLPRDRRARARVPPRVGTVAIADITRILLTDAPARSPSTRRQERLAQSGA